MTEFRLENLRGELPSVRTVLDVNFPRKIDENNLTQMRVFGDDDVWLFMAMLGDARKGIGSGITTGAV